MAAVVRQYELWDETPSAGEFYRRLTAEVATKREETAFEPAASTAISRRGSATPYC
ncbi:MAG: hypothetical protein RKO25_12140 [Candidatus Contendobacter sp.]|nr:hypothetical protein [Candidatus Contendobacter sp.]